MAARVFIDGQVGTTGLRIRELLGAHPGVELILPDEARRKDPAHRRELLNGADLVLLCLPDEAALEAVAMIEREEVRVIDASTAHRVDPGWVFGLPELEAGQRQRIAGSRRVSNPGCYSTAVALAVRPLVDARLLPRDAPLVVHALSGYSGGGRPLIARWQDSEQGLLQLVHEAPYALDREHKHIPEMRRHSGLENAPQFIPAVGPFRCGMRVEIPLHAAVLAPVPSEHSRLTKLALAWQDARGRQRQRTPPRFPQRKAWRENPVLRALARASQASNKPDGPRGVSAAASH